MIYSKYSLTWKMLHGTDTLLCSVRRWYRQYKEERKPFLDRSLQARLLACSNGIERVR